MCVCTALSAGWDQGREQQMNNIEESKTKTHPVEEVTKHSVPQTFRTLAELFPYCNWAVPLREFRIPYRNRSAVPCRNRFATLTESLPYRNRSVPLMDYRTVSRSRFRNRSGPFTEFHTVYRIPYRSHNSIPCTEFHTVTLTEFRTTPNPYR